MNTKLGRHVLDGSVLFYDGDIRRFRLGSTNFSIRHVIELDQQSQLTWASEAARTWAYEYNAWIYSHSPAQAYVQSSSTMDTGHDFTRQSNGRIWTLVGGVSIGLMVLVVAISPMFGVLLLGFGFPWVCAFVVWRYAEGKYRQKLVSTRMRAGSGAGLKLSSGHRRQVFEESIGPGLVVGFAYYLVCVGLVAGFAWAPGAVLVVSCLPGGIVTVAVSRGWMAFVKSTGQDAVLIQRVLIDEAMHRQAKRRARAEERQRRAVQRQQEAHLRWQQSSVGQMAMVSKMTGEQFERYCAEYFKSQGYRVQATSRGADHGIDLILWSSGKRTLVQCKRYSKPVGEPVIRDLYAVILHEGADAGIICASSSFTSPATTWAQGKPITLLTAEQLIYSNPRFR